ncbi:uncharacterized protein CDAR_296071 [Caerostris darwini]|uniref:Uncharacterized protein n=1 Tax=Caerostris darwini TaxID=1538125 RepID=A0AAV4SRT6_9ARAC|nr:uncharacterized protein CDAR_296071 [Caerostris darwini]
MALQRAATSSSPPHQQKHAQKIPSLLSGGRPQPPYLLHIPQGDLRRMYRRFVCCSSTNILFENAQPNFRAQPHRRVVALISEYRQKRYRSVWFREYDEYGAEAANNNKVKSPNPPPPQNHVDKNGTPTPPSVDAHLAAREALQETANDSCKTAAIPLELSRIESGERRQSSGYPPAQLSRTSLLGKPLKSGKHRGPRYRKSQALVYNFLERPRGYKSACYHILL